ncbi:MAG: hypothetical protein GY815_11845 [Gammaproteobacteria bacterium]|nr:hypothetical protein [Gammaproteobacteria bacterium]
MEIAMSPSADIFRRNPDGEISVGRRLYEIVCEYENLGLHRTGAESDHATTAWFVNHLRRMGASVNVHPFSFDRYDAKWSVEVNNVAVNGLPQFYGPCGEFELRNVPVGSIDLRQFDEIGARHDLENQIARAMASDARGLLIETRSQSDDIYAMNTHPDWSSDFPVMFASADAVGPANRIQLSARLTRSKAFTVVGRFGHSDQTPPLIITTPLSGWFTCAGERGTGIALTLRLAQELAAHVPVEVVAASGHEFQYMGCHEHLKSAAIDPMSRVLHMGSSIATLPMVRDGLCAIAHVTGNQFPDMAATLKTLDLELTQPDDPLSPACWQGESEYWAGHVAQMLSLAGVSPTFHTPCDTAIASTTPELLSNTYSAILETMKAMIL